MWCLLWLSSSLRSFFKLISFATDIASQPSCHRSFRHTVEKLTASYFLNDDFWFTVPGGRMMQTYKDAPKGDTSTMLWGFSL